ncbi:MAG: hypothetical protein ACRDOH_19860, partial [Streptosporangiaceae bacterium]
MFLDLTAAQIALRDELRGDEDGDPPVPRAGEGRGRDPAVATVGGGMGDGDVAPGQHAEGVQQAGLGYLEKLGALNPLPGGGTGAPGAEGGGSGGGSGGGNGGNGGGGPEGPR